MDERQSATPTGQHSTWIARRRRKPLSCTLCRQRKLSCDRERPACSRCRSAGRGDSCTYGEKPLYTSRKEGSRSGISEKSRAEPPSPVRDNIAPSAPLLSAVADKNILPLPVASTARNNIAWGLPEAHVTGAVVGSARPAIKADLTHLSNPGEPKSTEAVIFRGKNFTTQYYGSTNPTSLIGHFPELRSYMRESIQHHHSLASVQKELKDLDVGWKHEKRKISVKDAELHLVLPDQSFMDEAIELYFKTFETMYRIVHRPTFQAEYDRLRNDPTDAKPALIILILLMMATVSAVLETDRTYIGSASLGRERGALWIETAERWLRRQSKKNIYLAIWQIRCLLVVAKQMNRYKKKQMWSVAGDLVREGMAAGFHRDPGHKVRSPFDQEMRRRLWATMIELELQASIDRGMPSALAAVRMDCAPPLDVDDEDLMPDFERAPVPRPSGEYTATSFLCLARQSFDLRVCLNSRMNDLDANLPYEEVTRYEEMVLAELNKLPRPTEASNGSSARKLTGLARTVLDLQLRQFLISLHAPFARQIESNSRYTVSRMVCFNAAASLIEQHWTLLEDKNPILLLFRHDYFRAALSLAHHTYISSQIQVDFYFSVSHDTIMQFIQKALSMLEDSIAYIGTGFTFQWYISAASSLLRSLVQTERSASLKQEATNQVVKQYYRVLASQETFSRAKERTCPFHFQQSNMLNTPPNLPDVITNPAEMSYIDSLFSQSQDLDPSDAPFSQYFFGDPAAWTFDNLWGVE
ncbi:hypothetical protein BDW42DRAFT_158548 [Aspergillus taichungensis]|uniref:Zn(2)-C6 fungal-type domain-containing protein n=1 Tax=Aspergillus taichungensis TaxID=482145 RepID=A0A2J5I980_9EURO|nr:hypothetical protein BDW42DRAFT_158548 [Aspergillus taichungensis]